MVLSFLGSCFLKQMQDDQAQKNGGSKVGKTTRPGECLRKDPGRHTDKHEKGTKVSNGGSRTKNAGDQYDDGRHHGGLHNYLQEPIINDQQRDHIPKKSSISVIQHILKEFSKGKRVAGELKIVGSKRRTEGDECIQNERR